MNKKFCSLAVAWLSLVAGSLLLNIHAQQQSREEFALQAARAFFQEIVTTRLWNASTQGIYAPVNAQLQPNPYLKTPQRDLTTVDGRTLTLINPAFMTRQIAELAEHRHGVKFHITSLKPIRPENAPLAWEKVWLESFERGVQEQHAFFQDASGESLRYMAPLLVEKSCLKCHAQQGYKVGDVRGGISVTLPPATRVLPWKIYVGHGLVALFGLLGLAFFQAIIRNKIREIREEQEKYRQMFMENTAIKLLIDPEDGALVEVNEAACRFYGYTNEQMLQMRITDINTLPAESVREALQKAATEGYRHFVFPHKLSSGEIRQVEVHSGPIAVQGKTLLFSIVHDITDRAKQEEELYFMRFALDTVSDSAFWSEASGKLFYVNKAAYENLRYSREELLGMQVSDFDPNFPPEAWAAHWQDLKRKKLMRVETSHRSKDGRVYPVEVMATFVEYQGREFNCSFVRDISERVAAKNEIQKQNLFLQNILESLPYPFYVIDVSNYALVMANSAASHLANLQGVTCYQLTHKRDTPCDGEQHTCTLQEVQRTNGPVVLEHIHYDTDGRERSVEVHGYPIRDASGAIVQLIEYSKDITAQKLAEQERERLKTQLDQAYKMEAIGTLAGGIAHDFNNILGTIMGYAEMAKDDAAPDSPYQRDLDRVLVAAHRAKDLVQQILAFSRQTNVVLRPLKIQFLIKEGLKLLRSSIPSTITIKESIDSKCATILADPTQIHQILMNLCTNAYHAMEERGGVLAVTLKTTVLAAGDVQRTLRIEPGSYVELMVSDTGCGIRLELLDKIFDPYFTTKDTGRGTGMGLSIIHGIVTGCGGAISVDTELGVGSTFHVYFPAVEQEALPESAKHEDVAHGTERILFVDDERVLTEMGKDMLERIGYTVTPATSSSEALQKFAEDPEAFDLVITDQTMPGMTGSDLAQHILAIRPAMPIILCTGYSTIISAEKAKSMGIREFVLKPVIKNDIAKLIRKVLDPA